MGQQPMGVGDHVQGGGFVSRDLSIAEFIAYAATYLALATMAIVLGAGMVWAFMQILKLVAR